MIYERELTKLVYKYVVTLIFYDYLGFPESMILILQLLSFQN